jgi:hypothetical protein
MIMPTIDETYEPRMWRCEECRTILGVVLRNSNRVRRLWTLRLQIPDGGIEPRKTDIMVAANCQNHDPFGYFLVHGIDSAQGVGCNTCRSIQEWHPAEEILLDMLRRLRGDAGVRAYQRYRNEERKSTIIE